MTLEYPFSSFHLNPKPLVLSSMDPRRPSRLIDPKVRRLAFSHPTRVTMPHLHPVTLHLRR